MVLGWFWGGSLGFLVIPGGSGVVALGSSGVVLGGSGLMVFLKVSG